MEVVQLCMYMNLYLSKNVQTLNYQHLEMVLIEINHQNKTFIIGTCYRPPGMNALQINTFLANLQSTINSICQENPEAFFLLGDFNDTCLTWNSDQRESELKNKLLNLVQVNNLFQIIEDHTSK